MHQSARARRIRQVPKHTIHTMYRTLIGAMKAERSKPNNSIDRKNRPSEVPHAIHDSQRGTSVDLQSAAARNATPVAANRNTPKISPTPPA